MAKKVYEVDIIVKVQAARRKLSDAIVAYAEATRQHGARMIDLEFSKEWEVAIIVARTELEQACEELGRASAKT